MLKALQWLYIALKVSPESLAGPGSLPPGLISRRHRGFDDGASDISSVASSNMDYSGKINFRVYFYV